MIKKFYLPIISVVLIALAFVFSGLETFSGFLNIIKSPSVCVDYVSISLGGAMLNASLLLIASLLLLKALSLRITGPIFAGVMSVLGCGFYGANILNVIPIHLGIYLYTICSKAKYTNNIIPILFSAGISPAVSFLALGLDIPIYFSIPIAIFVGMIIGFVIPAISSHVIIFHNGYNLFNIGFALGIISMIFNGILSSFNIRANVSAVSYTNNSIYLYLGILLLSLAYLITGLIISRKELKKYLDLIKRSGRLITDFIRDYGVGISMINVALMGFISIIVCAIFKIELNGILFGSIIMIMGFASFGIHPKNSIILVITSILTGICVYYIVGIRINPVTIILVMGLAPIVGRNGFVWGIVVGILHTLIVPICSTFQGGYDMFNNGFAAGFIAGAIIPLIENLRREK